MGLEKGLLNGLPGSGLGEEALLRLIESTLDRRVVEAGNIEAWIRRETRLAEAEKAPRLLLLDASDVRVLAIIVPGRGLGYVEALANGERLYGRQALSILKGMGGDARLAVARLRRSVVEWSPRLSVYVKGIDLQHRQLVNALNSLYQSVLLGDERRELEAALSFLSEYTVFHFSTEERFMKRYGYPRLGEHAAQHRWFVDRVEEYRRRSRRGERLGLEVVAFLAEWTRRHIAGTDRDYGVWMRDNGILERLDARSRV